MDIAWCGSPPSVVSSGKLAADGVSMTSLVRELEERLGALDDEHQTWQLTTAAVEALAADGLVDVEPG